MLNVNRLVRVAVNLSPKATARRNFGTLLVLTDESVIGAAERIRGYNDIEGVASDFGVSSEAYKAAVRFFGQQPRPRQMYVGRFAASATSGELRGGIFESSAQAGLLTALNAISTGTLTVSIDGTEKALTAIDLHAATNLNQVASAIETKLTAAVGKVVWDGSRFVITSASTGATSKVSFATGSLAATLKLDQAQALIPTDGAPAETLSDAVKACLDKSSEWYALTIAMATMPTADKMMEVADLIEAASTSRLFAITETDTRILDSVYADDLGSKAKAKKLERTLVHYSGDKYAVCSLIGRHAAVNYSGSKTTITLAYKQEPGVVAADISSTQADTLKKKNVVSFAMFSNDTAIVTHPVMSNGDWIDERIGCDALQNALENGYWNLLYQSKTKVPQTDAGTDMLHAVAVKIMNEFVENGFVAPGTWNADGFGQLSYGDYLESGFYIYSQPMREQDQSIREQRIAPPVQIAAKLAGAIHEIDCVVSVNR